MPPRARLTHIAPGKEPYGPNLASVKHKAERLIDIQSYSLLRGERRKWGIGDAGALLLRFYKASPSPAAVSTQRITGWE